MCKTVTLIEHTKILKDVIREAKRQHYNRQVSNSSNETRTTWDIVRSVTGKLINDKTIQELEVNRKVIRNRQNIAVFVNNFFLSMVDDNINNNPSLCGLVLRVLGYRSGGPGSIPGTTRKKSSGSGTGSTQPHKYN
jgi:hypothetical protein